MPYKDPEKRKACARRFYHRNVDKAKAYRLANKERIAEKAKVYRAITIQARRKWFREYKAARWKTDIEYKLKGNLRRRLHKILTLGKGTGKIGSAVADLGCSVSQLKAYLEGKFQSGMSWENYGEWHIDHIKPLSAFQLSIVEEFKKACHFTNLQPLWKLDNIRKGGCRKRGESHEC